jgi:hypothetical protein
VQRAKLIHIDVDRRLGHEWDEWDGKPLPNQGNFDSPPWLFLVWSTVALAFALGVTSALLFLVGPRLALLYPPLPRYLWLGLAGIAILLWVWWGLVLLSHALRRPLLPERLAERGPLLRLMRLTSAVAGPFREAGLGGERRREGLQTDGGGERPERWDGVSFSC